MAIFRLSSEVHNRWQWWDWDPRALAAFEGWHKNPWLMIGICFNGSVFREIYGVSHGFSHELWRLPLDFPLNQSIERWDSAISSVDSCRFQDPSSARMRSYPPVDEHNYGKSPLLICKSSMNGPFSIATLLYQRLLTIHRSSPFQPFQLGDVGLPSLFWANFSLLPQRGFMYIWAMALICVYGK